MRRILLINLLLIIALGLSAQRTDSITDSIVKAQVLFDSLLVEGIREFNKPAAQGDYRKAVDALETTIILKPNNARAHYYLGYAYSRLNSNDGSKLKGNQKRLTLLASEQMEVVIRIDSAFKPELILSPYSKITSEWGSLAIRYLNDNINDSAIWAFEEGKRRGGFSDFMLSYRRIQLNQCSQNAILFSYGDDSFWNLLYLQTVENYRNDIAVIDMGLINAMWYQLFLKSNEVVKFTPAVQNEVRYYLVSWSDTIIKVPIKNSNQVYSWNFQSHGSYPYYIYAGDVAIQSIVIQNRFQRDIYLTVGMPRSVHYNLFYNFEDQVLINKFNPMGKSFSSTDLFNNLAKKVLNIAPSYNDNSPEEGQEIDNIRLSIMSRIYSDWSSTDNKENAKYLINLLLKDLPEQRYPIKKETKIMLDQLKLVVLDDY